MSLFKDILDSQITGRAVHKKPFIQHFTCDDQGEPDKNYIRGTVVTNAGQLRPSPVFYLEYGKKYNKFLASADEEGYICVIDTSVRLPPALDDSDESMRCRAQWLAHRNAVFDLAWAKDDFAMYTASGDQTVCLWDTSYAKKISCFKGHTGSVKALSVSTTSPDVVASGGRDGCLMVWDNRAPSGVLEGGILDSNMKLVGPVLSVKEPHRPKSVGTSRLKTLCGKARPSITSVQFMPQACGNVLASAGVDGSVKLWDLRLTAQPSQVLHVPNLPAAKGRSKPGIMTNPTWGSIAAAAESSTPTLGLRNHGVTSLALHPDTCQLLVSLTGGHLLLYDGLRPDLGPTRWFGGHTVSSFYVKAAFSPDGSHVVSGSSDGHTYVWPVDGCDGTRPTVLKGHEGEVTSPAWCPTDFGQLATAADDCTIKVWCMKREQQVEVADPKPQRCGSKWWSVGKGDVPMLPSMMSLGGGGGGGEVEAQQAEHEMTPRPSRPAPSIVLAAVLDEAATVDVAAGTTAGGAAAHSGAQMRLTTVPAPPAPGAAGSPTRRRSMVISNALRKAMQEPKSKRTKQQTLMEALQAASASAGHQAKRVRRMSDEDGTADENAATNWQTNE